MLKHAFISTLLVLSIPAIAEEPVNAESKADPIASDVSFVRLDVNGDGVIDSAEATADASLARAFASIAPQGKLDAKVFQAWKAASMKKQAS